LHQAARHKHKKEVAMTHEKIRILLAALPFVGAIACAGDATSTPPRTAADQAAGQTATTGGTQAPDTSASTTIGESNLANGDPSATSNKDSNPSGLTSPVQTTAGTSPAPGARATGEPRPATSDSTESLNDGKIVAIIQAADRGEIEQARDALRKATNERVKLFAQHMISDHSAAEAKLLSLDSTTGIAPEESPVTAQLKSGAELIMGNLRSASRTDFDKVYIDAQVSEHTQVLDLLDSKLIPQAKNVDLTKTLQAVRAKVAGHLKMAQDLQSMLAQAK
jgi:putative membrane protein